MLATPVARAALLLLTALPLTARCAVAADFDVTNQAEFDAALAAALQPGRGDTINVDFADASSGASLMLPGSAASIIINFNGLSGGPAIGNPTFDVGFGTTAAVAVGDGTTLNFDTSNGVARLRVGYDDGVNAGTGTVNMSGGQITGTHVGSNYFVIDVGRGSAATAGAFNQSGGVIDMAGGALQIGVAGGQGTYTMSNSAVVNMGVGTVYVGDGAGANGTLNIRDNAQFSIGGAAGQLYIGNSEATGTVSQDGAGSLVSSTAPNGINLGSAVDSASGIGGVGVYNLSAGELRLGGSTGNAGITLGSDDQGSGTLNQTGGVVTLNDTARIRFGAGTGTYNLSGGTLQINNANPFLVISGGTHEFNLGGGTIAGLTSFTTTMDFNLVDATTSIINTATGTSSTISGVMSGGGGLQKAGAGALVLNAANTYTGGTLISGGTLQLGASGSLATTGAVQVDAGATFDLNGQAQQIGALSGAGTILAPAGGSGTGGLAAGDASDTAFSGTIIGGFAKTGSGTMTVDGATFSGAAYIADGAFVQTSGTTSADYLAVGEGTGNTGELNVSGGLLSIGSDLQVGDFGGTGTVNQTGGTVRLQETCGDPASCVALNIGNQGGTGVYNISGGTLELNGGLNNLGRSDGANPASDGTLSISGDGLVVLRPEPGFSNGSLILGSRVATSDPGGQGEGSISQTGGTLRIENGSTLFLSGFGDGTYDLLSGSLQIGGNSLSPHYGGGAATGTYTFNLGGGSIQVLDTALTTSVDATLLASTISTIDTNALGATWSGVLSGAGTLAKTGAGALTLSGNNTYSGGTQLNAGSIVAGSATALGVGALNFNATSTLQFDGNFTLANAMNIAAARVASIDSNGNAAAIDGAIAGSGVLRKIGAGSLLLDGANTYSGGTWVNSGTLQLGPSGSLASTGALQVDAGATFDLNDQTQTIGAFSGAGDVLLGSGALTTNSASTTTFSGSITGTGSFTKGGSGTLYLTGASSYSGPTTVNAGGLIVNGSLLSDVTVAGGMLGGNGAIGGLMVGSGAMVAPGNSIGTINVSSNVTFQPGSTYEVEVDAAGHSDRIDALGTATINGGDVRVLAQGGAYSPNATYTILTAAGGRTGAFDGVSSNLVFLTPTLGYDANNVYLNLARSSVSFAEFAETSNQRAVAGALDRLPDSSALLPYLLTQDAQGIRQGFDALSGEVHASAAGVLVMNSFYVRDAIINRLIQASYSGGESEVAAPGAAGPTTVAVLDPASRMSLGGAGFDDLSGVSLPAYGRGLAFWTRGFGAWGDLDGNGNAAGLDRTLGGFVSGVDAGLGSGWRAGLATGYMRSDLSVDARASAADIDSYILGAYAGGSVGPFALRSGGAWTWNSLDTTRNVIFPGFLEAERASYNGDTGQLFAEIAYPFLYQSSAIEPFAGLSYVHVGTDGFTESGAIAGLTSNGADQNVGVSLLGLRAGTSLPFYGMTLTPHGALAWQYAFGDITPAQAFAFASTGIGFGISGVPIAHSSALIEAGLDLSVSEDAVLGLTYTGQLAEDLRDNSVQGRLNWRF